MARCRSYMSFWHVPERPFTNSISSVWTSRANLQIIADALAPSNVVPRGAAPGVKIVFSDGTGPKQTLYYFSTNLADGSFERSGFSAFLAKLGPADSLIKSASYLLHKPQFSGVRKLLLDRSAIIVQDDSGIPLAILESGGGSWLLAIMLGPSRCLRASTSPKWQGCFKALTRSNSGLDIDGARTSSNLLLAKMESPPSSEQELSPQSQAERNATETAVRSPKKTRKHVETATWSFGCRKARVFPFCW